MSNEVLILGVKGSGKTVFLSVLGHRYEGVGEFGLSLTPDRVTWNFAYEYYHTMAPEDGSEQRFPKATDPKDDPVPLTWLVRAGTEPLFRMTTLECAGETMVKAFGGEGDEEAEARFSEEMTAAFDAIDAGTAAGIASKADTVTKLRAMAKRAAVVCLFLNPRDFESQVAALPGRYRERLGRKLAQLREEGAGMEELRGAREANERALAIAREELKDRYGAMLDLLRTFLDNEAYRGKRLVFVLTQTGGLARAIEEAGGAWGYLTANIRQMESHDLSGRAEAIAVSAVNTVCFLEDEDGDMLERPDGPIESTGLVDFLLTVGGACSPRLAHLRETRRACLDAEQKFTDAKLEGLPAEVRWAAAREWRDAAAEWARAAARFAGELGNVRASVRQRTKDFAGSDAMRAERCWIAEDALRARLLEDVASGTVLDAGDLAAWQEVVNGAVERKGFEPWTLDELGLEEGWLEDSIRACREKWANTRKRFATALELLNWRDALAAVKDSGLAASGAVRRDMEHQAAVARRTRVEMECRAALEGEDEATADRKLRELAEAEEETGPSQERQYLEEGLACLRARLDVKEALEPVRKAFRGLDAKRTGKKETIATAGTALPRVAALLAAAEAAHGEDNFRDLHQDWETYGRRLEQVVHGRAAHRRRMCTLAVAAVLAAAAAWWALRLHGHKALLRGRDEALAMAADGDYEGARARLGRLAAMPLLGLEATDYATPEVYRRLEECQDYAKAQAEMLAARKAWEERRAAMVNAYKSESRCKELGGTGWVSADESAAQASKLDPKLNPGSDGLPESEKGLTWAAAQCRAAGKKYAEALESLARAEDAAAKELKSFLEAKEELARKRKERAERFRALEELAAREGIHLEDFAEWAAWKTESQSALLATASPRGELPSGANLKSLAQDYRKALAAGDARADRALLDLQKAMEAFIAKTSVRTAIARIGITDWQAAAKAADESKLSPQAAPFTRDLDAEWNRILRAGNATRTVVGTQAEWADLGKQLDALAGNPSPTDEDRAFVQLHKTVCDAAASYFAEKERRRKLVDWKAALNQASNNKSWLEADAVAGTLLGAAKTEEERREAEMLRNGVRAKAAAAAKTALELKTPNSTATKVALKAAGYGTEALGNTVVAAMQSALEELYPEAAPEKFPKSYQRDLQVLDELLAEATNGPLASARANMENRVQSWTAQWLESAERYADGATEAAGASESLTTAWSRCLRCEAAVNAVLASTTATPEQKKEAKGIKDTLPSLVLLHAKSAKNGDALSVQEVEYNGLCLTGIRETEKGPAVAILAAGGHNNTAKKVTVSPSVGKKKSFWVMFKGPGTQMETVEF